MNDRELTRKLAKAMGLETAPLYHDNEMHVSCWRDGRWNIFRPLTDPCDLAVVLSHFKNRWVFNIKISRNETECCILPRVPASSAIEQRDASMARAVGMAVLMAVEKETPE